MPEKTLPQHDMCSIVLIGSFNPRIFHPSWFVRHGLLPEGSDQSTSIEFLNNDFSAFETDWFRLEVLSDRFIMRSLRVPALELLRDLVMGTFLILEHTPINRVGLNSHAHYSLKDETAWHAFGHALAPKEPLWTPILNTPGTLSLTIEGKRPDDYIGHLRVKVEPSYEVAHGLFLETNDEFSEVGSESAGWVVSLLGKEWDSYRKRVEDIRSHLLAAAEADLS